MAHPVGPAKRPTTVLAGEYGHPLHPALVAVPIGAWVASVVLDVGSHVVASPTSAATAAHAAWWLLALGVLGAVAAASVGFLDLIAIPPGTRAWRTGLTHMSCNLAATGLFAVAWVLRRDDVAPTAGTSWGHVVLSLVALVLLSAGGYLGGELAYRYGVRVADEGTQATGFVARGAAGPLEAPLGAEAGKSGIAPEAAPRSASPSVNTPGNAKES
jgi:uncharacterized membrane protein